MGLVSELRSDSGSEDDHDWFKEKHLFCIVDRCDSRGDRRCHAGPGPSGGTSPGRQAQRGGAWRRWRWRRRCCSARRCSPAAARRQAEAAAAASSSSSGPAGVTIAGEIKNYVPITDAMLQNPDPNDWLVIRHDPFASNYSPLNQITDCQRRAVATRLGVVHERRRYAANRAARPQRRDLCEQYRRHHSGCRCAQRQRSSGSTTPAARNIAARGIALYQDKVIFMMSNGHLKALDARNGKEVWDAVTWEGHGSSSGPLIAKGQSHSGHGRMRGLRA